MSTYLAEQNAITRTKINIIKLKMGYCRYSYGVDPCTATAVEKCFNTFPTCRVKSVYDSIGKEYKFISANLPASTINDYGVVFPYIKSISDLPTEIKEEDTVVKRLKIEMYDDKDFGVGIDPYWEERRVQVSFWKTFIQRNKNYRNGIVELWEGFAGVSEDSFVMKFAGKLDNIEYNGGIAMLEAVDLLKELSNIKYPLNIDVRIADNVPTMFIANNQAEMLTLNAETLDYCRRTDFRNVTGTSASELTSSGGNVSPGTYYLKVYAYDSQDRPIGRSAQFSVVVDQGNSIQVNWSALSSASYYRIYLKNTSGGTFNMYWQDTASPYIILDDNYGTVGTVPAQAERYYQLTGDDPTDINDWTEIPGYNFTIPIQGKQNTLFSVIGDVRWNKEVIYYASYYLSAGVYYLSGVLRGQFDTEIDYHFEGSFLAVLYYSLIPNNPFTMLKKLLNLAGVDDAYIGYAFQGYAQSWSQYTSNPLVTLKPILKDVKLSRLYFDLVRLVNCMSWVNEDGKIDILNYDDDGGVHVVTDEANIISGSFGVDYNDESRMTRWLIFWNRFDIEESIDEANAYSRINIVADADAESDEEYGDIKEDRQYTVWFSEESDDIEKINTYVDALLQKRAARTRDAQEIPDYQVELKDASIKTGDTIKLSTKHLVDIYGSDYNEVPFRLIKKEMMNNRIAHKLLRKL